MRMVRVDDRIAKVERKNTKWEAIFTEFIAMDANTVELDGIMDEYAIDPARLVRNINKSAEHFGYRVKAFNRGNKVYLTKLID